MAYARATVGVKSRAFRSAMGLERGEHLRRRVGGEEQGLELGLDKIPLLRAQRIEVRLQQYLESAQVDEIAGLHHLQQGFLIHNAVEDLPQGVVIPRSGVAVTPTTSGPSGCQARQYSRMRR